MVKKGQSRRSGKFEPPPHTPKTKDESEGSKRTYTYRNKQNMVGWQHRLTTENLKSVG